MTTRAGRDCGRPLPLELARRHWKADADWQGVGRRPGAGGRADERPRMGVAAAFASSSPMAGGKPPHLAGQKNEKEDGWVPINGDLTDLQR